MQSITRGAPARRHGTSTSRAARPDAVALLDDASLFEACVARLIAKRGEITGSVRGELVRALKAMPSTRGITDPLAGDADERRLATALHEMARRRTHGPGAVRRFAVEGAWAVALDLARKLVTGPAPDEDYRQGVASAVARFLGGSGRRATPVAEVQACMSHLLDPKGRHFDWEPTPVTVVARASRPARVTAKTPASKPTVAAGAPPVAGTPDGASDALPEPASGSAPVDDLPDESAPGEPETLARSGDVPVVADPGAFEVDASPSDHAASPDVGTPPERSVPTPAAVSAPTHADIAAALASRGHFADAVDELRKAGPVEPVVGGLLEALDARLHFNFQGARTFLRRIEVPAAFSPWKGEVRDLANELNALGGPSMLETTGAYLAELFWNADLARRQRGLVDFLGRVASLQEIAVRWVVEDHVGMALRSKKSNADLNLILERPEHAKLRGIVHGRLSWRTERGSRKVPELTGRAGLSAMFEGIIRVLHDAVEAEPGSTAWKHAADRVEALSCAWEYASHLDGVKELRNRTIVGHDMAPVDTDEIHQAHPQAYRDRPAGPEAVTETCRLLLLNLGVEVRGPDPLASWGQRLAGKILRPGCDDVATSG